MLSSSLSLSVWSSLDYGRYECTHTQSTGIRAGTAAFSVLSLTWLVRCYVCNGVRSWSLGVVNSTFTPRYSFGVAVNGKDVVIIDGNIYSGTAANVDNTRVLNGPFN